MLFKACSIKIDFRKQKLQYVPNQHVNAIRNDTSNTITHLDETYRAFLEAEVTKIELDPSGGQVNIHGCGFSILVRMVFQFNLII